MSLHTGIHSYEEALDSVRIAGRLYDYLGNTLPSSISYLHGSRGLPLVPSNNSPSISPVPAADGREPVRLQFSFGPEGRVGSTPGFL